MKPRKAMRRIAAAFRSQETDVVIVLADRTSIRGRMVDSRADTEPVGPVGAQVAGPVRIAITIEVQP